MPARRSTPKSAAPKSGGARKATARTAATKRAPVVSLTPDSDLVVFEAVLRSETQRSLFDPSARVTGTSLADYKPRREQPQDAARALASLGFKIRHIGTYSISGEGSARLWEETFGTELERRRRTFSDAHPEVGNVQYTCHKPNTPFTLPPSLAALIDRAYPQIPPTFYGAAAPPLATPSPLPPRVGYHHLRVPADVATVLRAEHVHKYRVTGAGVLVAMTDTGFFRHPFYAWHGYNYSATLSPDAVRVDHDEVGHGTAEAANIFASAPDVDFVGVKMGSNAALAFKTASDLRPAIITNSWGWDIPGGTLPNFLRPLEAAVVEAVRERGITVCFSAGNGHHAFPGQMPDVLSVGGVYADEGVTGEDFALVASDYASSFDSQIYPGRHVPDVCGLVGMTPRGIYIMLPVEPGDQIDVALASGGAFPASDGTKPDDGWAVISGTSAASPQIAGVCALLKQVQPGLSPDLMKAILRASTRDVNKGQSAMGQPAGDGFDGATGAGLVDALRAFRLARSVTPQRLDALPPPR